MVSLQKEAMNLSFWQSAEIISSWHTADTFSMKQIAETVSLEINKEIFSSWNFSAIRGRYSLSRKTCGECFSVTMHQFYLVGAKKNTILGKKDTICLQLIPFNVSLQ